MADLCSEQGGTSISLNLNYLPQMASAGVCTLVTGSGPFLAGLLWRCGKLPHRPVSHRTGNRIMHARTRRTPSAAGVRPIIESGWRRSFPELAVALCLISSTAGCGGFPLEADYVEPFAPPPVYLQWWGELERCARSQGDFTEIRWYVGESVRLDGEDLYGFWSAPRTIVLERFYTTSGPVVKHEMLHHLTRGEMRHSHPAFRICTRDDRTFVTP